MAFRAVSDFFSNVGRAHRMATEFDRLNRMNSNELSRMGLDSGDIGSHVFRKYSKNS